MKLSLLDGREDLLVGGGLVPVQVFREILALHIPKSDTSESSDTSTRCYFDNLHFELTEDLSRNRVKAAVIVGGETSPISVSEVGQLTRSLKVV